MQSVHDVAKFFTKDLPEIKDVTDVFKFIGHEETLQFKKWRNLRQEFLLL